MFRNTYNSVHLLWSWISRGNHHSAALGVEWVKKYSALLGSSIRHTRKVLFGVKYVVTSKLNFTSRSNGHGNLTHKWAPWKGVKFSINLLLVDIVIALVRQQTINRSEITLLGGENFSQREFLGWELRVKSQTWGIVKNTLWCIFASG